MSLIIPNSFDEARMLSWQLILGTGDFRFPKDQKHYISYLMTKTPEEHIENLRKEMKGKVMNLVDNQFPYTNFLQMLSNVQHKMILSKQPLTPAQIDMFLIEVCKLHPKNYFWYENQNSKKSRPEIFHVHVFVNNFND